VAGLPVLVSSVCGYAHHVTRSNTGLVLDSPFDQNQMNDRFQSMLNSSQRQEWQRNGINYAASEDLYSLPEKAADVIERYVGKAGPG
jgi:UDP-glucose:(heptosyl)LPS alpha-1,3-glucosyltransferase